jgi:hypothetical protein
MLKNLFKAAKNILKSPVGGALIGAAIPGLGKFDALKGIAPFFESKLGSGLTSAGIAALMGANPRQAIASGALGALVNQGQMFPQIGEGQGQGGGVVDLITGIFKKPEVPTLGEYAKETIKTLGFDPESETGKALLIEQFPSIQNSYQEKYSNVESLFEKSLPYLTAAGGLYAMNQMQEDRPEYDVSQNPYMYAQGGGVQNFAMGGTSEFPRMYGTIKGPGDGQSDSIPAMLSNDEHVLTKREVETIGMMAGGDVDTGHKILKDVRTQIDDIGEQMGVSKV